VGKHADSFRRLQNAMSVRGLGDCVLEVGVSETDDDFITLLLRAEDADLLSAAIESLPKPGERRSKEAT